MNSQNFPLTTVRNIPEIAEFICDSQDVDAVKENLGPDAQDYDAFFVIVGDGDYSAAWEIVGTVP